MSIINITITHDLKKVENWLGRVRSVIRDLSGELKDSGKYLKEYFSGEVFRSEGASYGATWAPLSPRYEAEKSRRYPLAGILRATGRMQESFEMMSSSDYCLIYNTTDYLQYHQTGTFKMPQRFVMNLDRSRVDTVAAIISKGISERIMSNL